MIPSRRAILGAALGLGIAALVPVACSSPTKNPPPPHTTAASATSGGGGNGGAGGSSGSLATGSGAGPGNVCECVAEAFAPGSTCADCFHESTGAPCADAIKACDDDPSCIDLLVTLAACDAGPTCLSKTLATHPGRNRYLDVLSCACMICAPLCSYTQVLKCDAGKYPEPDGGDAGDASDAGDAVDEGDAG